MDLSDDAPKRRRGASLEAALLDAAWAELVEVGYSALSYEGVARRAETSRTVVYRRWPTKTELVRSAVARYFDQNPIATPDTGSLRGDLIALLESVTARAGDLIAVVTIRLGAYFEETGTTFGDLKRTLMRTADHSRMQILLERAVARGEIPTADVPARIKDVPADLMRNEMLVSGRAASQAAIVSIVDEVFLPLVGYDVNGAGGPRTSPAAR